MDSLRLQWRAHSDLGIYWASEWLRYGHASSNTSALLMESLRALGHWVLTWAWYSLSRPQINPHTFCKSSKLPNVRMAIVENTRLKWFFVLQLRFGWCSTRDLPCLRPLVQLRNAARRISRQSPRDLLQRFTQRSADHRKADSSFIRERPLSETLSSRWANLYHVVSRGSISIFSQ